MLYRSENLTVRQVAQALLERLGPMESWKLQKLCYYTQGFHLALTDKTAFAENIEAWKDGPVVPDLFQAHKGLRTVYAIDGSGEFEVSVELAATIERVSSMFGPFSGDALRATSHIEPPWMSARGDKLEGESSNAAISIQQMREHFSQLLAEPQLLPEFEPTENLAQYFARAASNA
jgi:uncharacterized phage-associated protein